MKEPMTRNELEIHCDVLGAVRIDWPVRMSLSRTIRDHDAALRAKVEALTPHWTDTKPTEPGWYWYKGLVWGNKVTKMLELCRDPLSRSLYSAIWGGYVDMMDGQWAGPINPPEAP